MNGYWCFYPVLGYRFARVAGHSGKMLVKDEKATVWLFKNMRQKLADWNLKKLFSEKKSRNAVAHLHHSRIVFELQ